MPFLRLVGVFLAAAGLVAPAALALRGNDSGFRRVRVEAATPSTTAGERDGRTRLVASASGIGIAEFGADAESLERRLTELLGEPDERIAKPCPNRPGIRWLRWRNLNLVFDRNEFRAYLLTAYAGPNPRKPIDMATPQRLRLGDSIGRLRNLYGPVSFYRPPHFRPDTRAREFRLATTERTFWGGAVDALGTAGRVVVIRAGEPCGS